MNVDLKVWVSPVFALMTYCLCTLILLVLLTTSGLVRGFTGPMGLAEEGCEEEEHFETDGKSAGRVAR